ncbi:hypothetical protein CMI37_19900 [Candidatus Pacearchaeota archaeon]|jgi:hypothetical protein|nr:hypothetical protein [Candidatus Pacearchaeota archaeon]|tara:strand:- start:1542 stop:2978 length:1437 start_codon:yes stop_codon:yes gene_type:complete
MTERINIIASVEDKASASLNKINGRVGALGDRARTAGKRIAKMGAIMGVALAGVGVASLKMAMDAVESENLFEVAMGGMADSAREWSEDLRDQLGLNSYELRKNVSVFNQMFTSMGLGADEAFEMSTGLTELANDMASFFNLKPEDAFAKLQAGITGEAEPLKRLGILIDEHTIKNVALKNGIISQGEAMTQQQKVQARYMAILEQTSNAQGDLARTMDSPTNRLRVMKARMTETAIEIGVVLLPAFERILDVVLPVLTTVAQALPGWVQKFMDTFKKIEFGVRVFGINFRNSWKMIMFNIKSTVVNALNGLIGFFESTFNRIIRTVNLLLSAMAKLPGGKRFGPMGELSFGRLAGPVAPDLEIVPSLVEFEKSLKTASNTVKATTPGMGVLPTLPGVPGVSVVPTTPDLAQDIGLAVADRIADTGAVQPIIVNNPVFETSIEVQRIDETNINQIAERINKMNLDKLASRTGIHIGGF